MKTQRYIYIKNFLFPCLFFSAMAGAGTGALIFLFKLCASYVISLSSVLYAAVREEPRYIPLLLLAAAVLGLGAAALTHFIPDCRGGGIPTSVALLRGLVTFRWLRCILSVFFSSMLTYLGGLPLGNEGPSVQMGTAVGKGVVTRHPAWNRYIMTGGASAGFAAATGAPLTGILFAFEEAHRRFSPLLFLVSSLAALTSSAVMKLLCSLSNIPYALFHFGGQQELPLSYYWVPILIGVLVGFAAALFTKAYQIIRRFIRKTLKKVPHTVKIVSIFLITALVGLMAPSCLGSGHDLVDTLMEGHGMGRFLVLLFAVRALLLLTATNADITGGLFVPTLAFGAILGGISGNILTAAHLLPEEYYPFAVITGITAFLSASSRTPLMALAFAFESLGAGNNLLPAGIGIAIAFLVIETIGITDFTDIVIEAKTEAAHAGKHSSEAELDLTVAPDSFVVGKEIRDILWPPSCIVFSVERSDMIHTQGVTGLGEGDILHIHCRTYDAEETLRDLEALVGKQANASFRTFN